MEPIACFHCGRTFTPRNRNQYYCSQAPCQRARKAAWQRRKMKTDPEYRTGHKMSQHKWLNSRPDYWKDYRRRHPEQVERNRMLQTIRDRRQRASVAGDEIVLAKMDAGKRCDFEPVGRFWLVPLLAKMDARKVGIYTISGS